MTIGRVVKGIVAHGRIALLVVLSVLRVVLVVLGG